MAAYGGLVFGPAATLWYRALSRVNLSSKALTIGARVGLDQAVFATTNLCVFLSTMSFLEGSDPKEKLRSSYWTALKTNWIVWPAVQAGNFAMVPLEHRVLVVNLVSIGWNCYLSYINSASGNEKTKAPA
jgi:protein Mpv17